MSDRNIEALITQVLETREEPVVPVDFAARVRAVLPVMPAKKRSVSVGKLIAMMMAVLAAIVAFALASRASVRFTSLAFDIECVLMLQTLAIAYWLSAREGRRS